VIVGGRVAVGDGCEKEGRNRYRQRLEIGRCDPLRLDERNEGVGRVGIGRHCFVGGSCGGGHAKPELSEVGGADAAFAADFNPAVVGDLGEMALDCRARRAGERRRQRDKLTYSAARRACCRAVAWWTIAFAFVVGKLNGVRGKTRMADPFWLSDWLAVGLPWSTAELLGTVLYEHPVVAPQVAHLRQVPLRASVKLLHSAQESPV